MHEGKSLTGLLILSNCLFFSFCLGGCCHLLLKAAYYIQHRQQFIFPGEFTALILLTDPVSSLSLFYWRVLRSLRDNNKLGSHIYCDQFCDLSGFLIRATIKIEWWFDVASKANVHRVVVFSFDVHQIGPLLMWLICVATSTPGGMCSRGFKYSLMDSKAFTCTVTSIHIYSWRVSYFSKTLNDI